MWHRHICQSKSPENCLERHSPVLEPAPPIGHHAWRWRVVKRLRREGWGGGTSAASHALPQSPRAVCEKKRYLKAVCRVYSTRRVRGDRRSHAHYPSRPAGGFDTVPRSSCSWPFTLDPLSAGHSHLPVTHRLSRVTLARTSLSKRVRRCGTRGTAAAPPGRVVHLFSSGLLPMSP